ncbi:hypothetical protein D3C87_2103360 [compost metagenome]
MKTVSRAFKKMEFDGAISNGVTKLHPGQKAYARLIIDYDYKERPRNDHMRFSSDFFCSTKGKETMTSVISPSVL